MRPLFTPSVIYSPGMCFTFFLICFPVLLHAAVLFTSPTPGATIHFSTPLVITWADNGVPPSLAKMIEYELHLCAGGQDVTTMQLMAVLQQKTKPNGPNEVTVTIDPSWGGSSLANA